MIYFDNNATTSLAPEVETVYSEALKRFGNASSVHGWGREARRLLEESREKIAALFRIPESTLVFTSGGTESLNAAMLGTFFSNQDKKHLLVLKVEHPAVLETARFLSSQGVEVTYLEVDAMGRMDPSDLHAAIRSDTAMIAVMFANNEIGNLYPVKEIGEIARRRGIFYLCDAVQAVGKVPIDLSRLPIDFLACSAHKVHGPKGVGFLYIREGLSWEPLLHGGRQERGRRAGTENLAGIVAMAKALELAHERMFQDEKNVGRLRDCLQQGLFERIPGLCVYGDPQHRIYNTLNVGMEGVSGETVLMNLDLAGIAVSIGAACESGSVEPSHVLQALGLKGESARGGLRFSLSRYNTEAEIAEALEVIPAVVARIRAKSV